MARPRKNSLEVIDESVGEENEIEEKIEVTDPADNKKEIIVVTAPSKKELGKEKLDQLIKEETRLVKGRFVNKETPGGSLRVQIRKYPNIPPFDKVMMDGESYEVPLYVARHLNGLDASAKGCGGKINTCSWPTHGFKWDPDKPMPSSTEGMGGIPVPIIGVQKWNRRFGFESLEFDTSIQEKVG